VSEQDITFRQGGRTIRFRRPGLTDVTKSGRVIPNAKRFALGVVYPANRVDGHKDFMGPDEVERVAWDYARNHRQIGMFHADGTLGHADVVESYIHRGPDWVTAAMDGTEVVIKAGDWVMGALFDPPAWQLVVSDAVNGWSVDGRMKRRKVLRSTLAV
jgi:hypothetical protein